MSGRFPLILLAALALSPLRADPAAPLLVACVGDSITFGSHVENREREAYPFVLARLLGPGYTTANYGVSGATLLKRGNKPYWKQKEFHQALASNPQIVVLMLGTNDSKTVNTPFAGDFEADLTMAIGVFQNLPSRPTVWLCLPPPVYKTNYTIQEATLAPLRAVVAKVAHDRGLGLIDVNQALTGHADLYADGVHPVNAGAALIAQAVADAIKGK